MRDCHLQEWFGGCIVKFASSLPVKSSSTGILVSGEVPPVSDASVQTLTSLAKDFEELAHTCLLVLHLEVCVVATHLAIRHICVLSCTLCVKSNLKIDFENKICIE